MEDKEQESTQPLLTMPSIPSFFILPNNPNPYTNANANANTYSNSNTDTDTDHVRIHQKALSKGSLSKLNQFIKEKEYEIILNKQNPLNSLSLDIQLLGEEEQISTNEIKQIIKMIEYFVEGDYLSIIQNELWLKLLDDAFNDYKLIYEGEGESEDQIKFENFFVEKIFENVQAASIPNKFIFFITAIANLQLFITHNFITNQYHHNHQSKDNQNNKTHDSTSSNNSNRSNSNSVNNNNYINRWSWLNGLVMGSLDNTRSFEWLCKMSNSSLSLNYESVYEYSQNPFYLFFARSLIIKNFGLFQIFDTSPIWKIRTLNIHQQLFKFEHIHSHDIFNDQTNTIKFIFNKFIKPLIYNTEDLSQYNNNNIISSSNSNMNNNNNDNSNHNSADKVEMSVPLVTRIIDKGTPIEKEELLIQRLIASMVCIEISNILLNYWKYQEVKYLHSLCSTLLGFEYKLTGIMGKRTIHQKNDIAQLVLLTNHNKFYQENTHFRLELESNNPLKNPTASTLFPPTVELDSDVLLSEITLNDTSNVMNESSSVSCLNPLEQCLLLSAVEYKKRTTPSKHISTREQSLAFLERILSKINFPSWSVKAMALVERSKLECEDSHKQMRAVQQLDAVINAYQLPDQPSLNKDEKDSANPNSRLHAIIRTRISDVHTSSLFPSWTIKKQMAHIYVAMGMVQAALDLYEDIHMYDGMASMLVLLGRKSKAEALVREQINSTNDPAMWCLLGEITDNPEHFIKAWEVSQNKYPRAKRALGKYYMTNKDYSAAIDHYRTGLELNPVYPFDWFAMGFCGMEIQDWQVSSYAFTKVVTYDPEYGDAWNNLAVSHINLKNKKAAFAALEQASRLKYEDWKTWENYMWTAIDVGEFQKSMTAMERVVQLKSKNTATANQAIDQEVLNILTKYIEESIQLRTNKNAIDRFRSLLVSISDLVVNSPQIWNSNARIAKALGQHQLQIEHHSREVRVRQSLNWLEEPVLFMDTVNSVMALADACIHLNSNANLFTARSTLDGVITKALKSERFQHSESIALLQTKLDQVKATKPISTFGPHPSESSTNPSTSSYLQMFK